MGMSRSTGEMMSRTSDTVCPLRRTCFLAGWGSSHSLGGYESLVLVSVVREKGCVCVCDFFFFPTKILTQCLRHNKYSCKERPLHWYIGAVNYVLEPYS